MCAFAFLAAAGCGGSPSTPIQPTSGPSIACPAAVSDQSSDGNPIKITYADPTVAGGLKPLTVSCTPSSGTAFAVGATTVTCSVADAQQRTASCTFSVTVTHPGPPRLTMTQFLAFGDSITAGEIPDSSDTPTAELRVRAVHPDLAYPARLLTILSTRYPSQTFTIVNDGIPGERTTDGVTRLPVDLAKYRPQVVLLQEGVNDVNKFGATAIPATLDNLRTMIRTARASGAQVVVGTLLPQIAGLLRAAAPELMAPFNAQLVPMATAEGATVVDLYAGLQPNLPSWISPLDGLHPTAAGYLQIAQLFSGVIITKFETTAPVTPTRVR